MAQDQGMQIEDRHMIAALEETIRLLQLEVVLRDAAIRQIQEEMNPFAGAVAFDEEDQRAVLPEDQPLLEEEAFDSGEIVEDSPSEIEPSPLG